MKKLILPAMIALFLGVFAQTSQSLALLAESSGDFQEVPDFNTVNTQAQGNGNPTHFDPTSLCSTAPDAPCAPAPDQNKIDAATIDDGSTPPCALTDSAVCPAIIPNPDATVIDDGGSTTPPCTLTDSAVCPAIIPNPDATVIDDGGSTVGEGNGNGNNEGGSSNNENTGGGGGGGFTFFPTNVAANLPTTDSTTPPQVLGEQVFSDGNPTQEVLGEQVTSSEIATPTFPKTGFGPTVTTNSFSLTTLFAYLSAVFAVIALSLLAYSHKTSLLSSSSK